MSWHHIILVSWALASTCLAVGRRGLAYSDASLAQYFSSSSAVSWGYNWGYPSQNLDKKWEFVPMLWGNPTNNPSYIDSWNTNVASALKNGTKHLLAFNEPDINNLSPADAAAAYRQYMQPYAGKASLGAPAVTNGGGQTGLAWLEQFIGNCSSCTIDFVPIHWYANWNQPDYFASHVQQAYAAAGHRPLWITEFAAYDATAAQQVSFLKTVVPWLDSLSYVQRYSYFGVFKGRLIDANGSGLSDIGKAYATISNVNSTTPTSNVS